MKTVIAVDTSFSTKCKSYYSSVNNIVNQHPNATIISWNTRAEILKNKTSFTTDDADGCTNFDQCLKLLNVLDGEYFLLVITDGEISNESFCKEIFEKSRVFQNIQKVEIHFIGNEDDMNTRIITVFENISDVSGFINGECIGKKTQEQDIQIEDILDEEKFKNLRFTIASKENIDESKLYSRLKEVEYEILNQLSEKATIDLSDKITEYFRENNYEDCAKFIRENYSHHIDDKKKIQSMIQQLINMSTNSYTRYNLNNFKPIKEIDVEEIKKIEPDVEETCFDIECDILYEKCTNLCMLIKNVTDEKNSILETDFKKFAACPFELLNHKDLLEKLNKSVEFHKIDLKTYEMLQDKEKSPFTRDKLKGVYIFHNSNMNFEKLLMHNSRSISVLFGTENKLPGNRYVWNIVFLYAMAKYHPAWKEHKDLLFDEIKYIAENAKVYISLSSLINPNVKTKLEIALWYCVNVSPLAFPNSIKNRIRNVGFCLYEFYSDIFGVPEAVSVQLLNTWDLWKYFVRNRSSPQFQSEIFAQFLNHKIINGNFVFFASPIEERYGYLKNFDKKLIAETYLSFQKNFNPSLYDNIMPVNISETQLTNGSWFSELEINLKKQTEENEKTSLEKLSHVEINPKTCLPFVICPVTKKHWKECATPYDIFSESYLHLFKRYCYRFQKYPSSAEDLISFHSKLCLKHHLLMIYNDFVVYKMNKILEIFANIMEMYSCEEYLKQTNEFISEAKRLKYE